MNMSMLSLLIVLVVAAVFAGAWFLSLAEAKRLRARNEDLADRLTDVTAELSAAKERARNLEDAKAAMSEQFQLVSHQAMQASSDQLLKRAEESFVAREKLAMERMNSSLKPVAEHLTRFEAQVKAMEEARAGETGGLKQQISDLLQASHATREVTQKLAGALRRGAGVQGKWGEEVLRNVLQAAGLSARFDFVEQHSLDGEGGRLRPDVVVRLPGEKSNGIFVIDSKVNLTDYLQAAEAADEGARELHMRAHAQAMRNHVRDLSAKAYWDQFRDQVSPDFVAMFIPGDGLLSTALEYAPDLMTEAMDRKVIIVTPTTLFALCKAVAYGWRVEDQMKNATQIADLGRELYKRLSVMGGHVSDVGTALGRAVDKYNAFVGSLDSQVLTQAKKFEDLQVEHQGKPVPELPPVEGQPRASNKLKLLESTEADTAKLDF
ncbi:MAG: DNA recombination protein RmuC [Asticcacaulis sp.]|uniref:DNA recombination protein RmuC n=1 Tax=Asticcacaulis sp. TaxID=1872648 RepID=UPI0039E54190